MKVGDLVYFYEASHSGFNNNPAIGRIGLVLEIINWVDKGAADRNFGTDVKVLWPDGSKMLYSPGELMVVDESG